MVTDGSTIVVFSLTMKLDWADCPRPNLKKLGCALSESFFVNGVEIDAHENKNTIGANLSLFMADLVVYELLQGKNTSANYASILINESLFGNGVEFDTIKLQIKIACEAPNKIF